MAIEGGAERAKGLLGDAAFAAWKLATRHKVPDGSYSGFVAAATYQPWRTDGDFQRVRQQVRRHTMVDERRLYELWSLIDQVHHLPGDVLEVGVWRGGSGCLLASRCAAAHDPATVFLADTFAGVVKAGDHDTVYRGGEHADTSAGEVEALVRSMGLSNVELLVGIFPDDTAGSVEGRMLKFVHVDVDTFGSAEQVTEWVLPRLARGGIVVFDDYGIPTTPGVRTYVDGLRGRRGLVVVHNLNMHAVVVKVDDEVGSPDVSGR